MAAVTQPNVVVTDTGWTQLSAATIQTLQVLHGVMGLVYADSQPSANVMPGSIGHVLSEGQFMSNGSGGTSWGRATAQSRSAHVAVTEG